MPLERSKPWDSAGAGAGRVLAVSALRLPRLEVSFGHGTGATNGTYDEQQVALAARIRFIDDDWDLGAVPVRRPTTFS